MADADQHREQLAQLAGAGGADAFGKQRIDAFRGGGLRFGGGASARGERDHLPAAIVRILRAFEVAAFDQCIDQLPGGLLGNAQVADQHRQGRIAGAQRQPADHVQAVPGDVIVARGFQRLAHRGGVGVARMPQQGGDGDDLVPGRFGRHGGFHQAN